MKGHFLLLLIFLITSFIMVSCEKERLVEPAPVNKNPSFVEEFDSVGSLSKEGWVFRNNSKPGGFAQWTQATGTFTAFSYYWNGQEYAACNFTAGTGVSNMSVWMITKPIPVKDGDIISFYTRTLTSVFFPDRLQFRANFIDDNHDVANDSASVGNFTKLIFDINPNQIATGTGSYPRVWTKYEYTVSGLSANPANHRFAFRYYVRGGGTGGANADYIGVDKLEFTSAQ